MKTDPLNLLMRIQAKEIMGSSEDYVAGDEGSGRVPDWSGDYTGDDADGSVGVTQAVILYWEARLFPLRVIGAWRVADGLKGCLRVQVAVGEWGGRTAFKLIG